MLHSFDSAAPLMDEIERLIIVYDKAQEYLNKISSAVTNQIELWRVRRNIVFNSDTELSFKFLESKTNRINELSIDAVQTLCRADILFEQIQRIDPQSSNNAHIDVVNSTRSFSQTVPSSAQTNLLNPNRTLTAPANNLRAQSVNVSSFSPRTPTVVNDLHDLDRVADSDRPGSNTFQPITTLGGSNGRQTQSTAATPLDNFSSSSSSTIRSSNSNTNIQRMNNFNEQNENFISASAIPRNASVFSVTERPVKVPLQRIPGGTSWPTARIEAIDSVSAFYVQNCDRSSKQEFEKLTFSIDQHYKMRENNRTLKPLTAVKLADFGVAKFHDDKWYRARVYEIGVNFTCSVVFIDYGNISEIKLNQFFPLCPEFASLPAQAVACSLHEAYPSITLVDMIWTDAANDFFREKVLEKNISVVFQREQDIPKNCPIHFVSVRVNQRDVANEMKENNLLVQKPNSQIARDIFQSITDGERILFNGNIESDD